MKRYASILVVMLAAVSLFGAASLEQERVVSAGRCTVQDVLVMDGIPVALPRSEMRQNPWIRLDEGEGYRTDSSVFTVIRDIPEHDRIIKKRPTGVIPVGRFYS